MTSAPAPNAAPLRRVGVIGDVHACDVRLEQLLRHFAARTLDAVWCVGDVLNGPGDNDRCARLLAAAAVVTVRGNHDRWCLRGGSQMDGAPALSELSAASQAFLRGLPATVERAAPDGTPVLLCHGLGRDDMDGISAGDYGYALEVNEELAALRADGRFRIVVKGHRHQPSVWRVDQVTFVDAGTLLRHDSPVCGAELDLELMQVRQLALDDGGAVTEVVAGACQAPWLLRLPLGCAARRWR